MYLIRLLTSFNGRARRLEMWFGSIFLVLASAILLVTNQFMSGLPIDELVASRDATEYGFLFPDAAPWQTNAISAAILLASFYGLLALHAKRLHDRNWSAWWLALFYGGPILLDGAGEFLLVTAEELQASGSEDANPYAYASFALLIVRIGISLWFFVEFFFFRGTQGPNRFGTDPLGDKAVDAKFVNEEGNP